MDRAYLDFERLNVLHSMGAFFVLRAKSNTKYRHRYSRDVDKSTGVQCDQTIVLTGVESKRDYPQPLRRVKYRDAKTGKTFNSLTNNFIVSPVAIADLYRHRWQVELFFKWIKQHLRIKSFYGTSENAVKTQIRIAGAVYVLVAIIKKRLGVSASLYTILQSLSITLFEKTPLFSVLSNEDSTAPPRPNRTTLTHRICSTYSWDTSDLHCKSSRTTTSTAARSRRATGSRTKATSTAGWPIRPATPAPGRAAAASAGTCAASSTAWSGPPRADSSCRRSTRAPVANGPRSAAASNTRRASSPGTTPSRRPRCSGLVHRRTAPALRGLRGFPPSHRLPVALALSIVH